MPNKFLVKQDALGRWLWDILASDEVFGPNNVKNSIVTFERECQANKDCQQHFDAVHDETGRKMRSEDELRFLIRAGMYSCTECLDSYYGRVYWRQNDSTGCNWSISSDCRNNGGERQEIVHPVLDKLQQTYNLKH